MDDLIAKLRVKNPLRDVTFWAAIAPIVVAFSPPEAKDWIASNQEVFYPLIGWLVMNGWLRQKSLDKVHAVIEAGRNEDRS